MNPPSPTSWRHYESVSEAAARVGVSTKTVCRWIDSSELAGFRIGTSLLRVDPEELDRLLTLVPSAVSPVNARRAAQ
jgi:excisionase family DNA binding protein